MRSKAWLAAPVLLAHAEVTQNIISFSMGPKLRYPHGTMRFLHVAWTNTKAWHAGDASAPPEHTYAREHMEKT